MSLILAAAGHTALYSAAAAVLATLLAIPVSTLAIRHRNRLTLLIERISYLPMALPGLVIALGLVSFSVRYAFSLYQSSLELIVAYAILFLPLAIVGVRSALGQASPRLEEVGRSLGANRTSVFLRITLPVIAPGLAAAFALSSSKLDRADRHAAAAPHRRQHPGDPVLGLHDRLLLWRRRSLRGPDGRHLGAACLPAEPTDEDDLAAGTRLMSALSVKELWKGYGEQPVLRGVDLEVPAGSLSAVLGLSGCGKTTLLRVIAGFERAERGAVSLGGVTIEDGTTYVPPERRSVGYVPQEGALFPHLNVAGNVGFGLTRAERRGTTVDELLEMVGIGSLGKRLPHELSGGEQQRVALARALARRPQALLLDEPFSSLDASLRTRVRQEVHELLRRQGITTVLVTHDQEEALSMADNVAVLREGRIVQQGAPAELYQSPADARLAGFLGEVNLLDAEFGEGTAATALGVLALRGGPPRPAGARGVVMLRPEHST